MTFHYSDLGSTSDWLKKISYAVWPIRSTTQIWKWIWKWEVFTFSVTATMFSSAKCKWINQFKDFSRWLLTFKTFSRLYELTRFSARLFSFSFFLLLATQEAAESSSSLSAAPRLFTLLYKKRYKPQFNGTFCEINLIPVTKETV